MTTLTIPDWAHGRPGMGQGGWGCGSFAAAIGEPVTIALRAPMPLETTLEVIAVEGGWQLVAPDGTVVMEARPALIAAVQTTPVEVAAATAARNRFDLSPDAHVARTCFSCGVHDDSMQVWPGSLQDGTGRVATVWWPPAERADASGIVDERVVWTVLDCTSGFYVSEPEPGELRQHSEPEPGGAERRHGVTVQYSVRLFEPVRANEPYVLVGHQGRFDAGWDGRKRGAGASMFDADGHLVAYADSFWVEI